MKHAERLVQEILQTCAQTPASELALETDDEGVDVRLIEAQLHFHHSFVSGSLAARASQSSQAIVRACTNKQRSIARILDLTAGWGIDSLTLATHGKRVTMLEQNRLVYAILAHSLACLGDSATGAIIAGRMTLENTNALDYLQKPDSPEFDCIYLDPMFPQHRSGAKPAKEMQILQALTENVEVDDCFELALGKATRRVVVKRPAKATNLKGAKPDLVYREKTIRFDVYLTA
jgi:16S rRNA (guanine1516-N2)-methyltransferase